MTKPFRNKLIVILFLLFFCGVLYGSLAAATAPREIVGQVAGITGGFADKRAEQSLLTTFVNSFGTNIVLLIIIYLLGFSAISQPIELFLPIFYGLGVGISMGVIYKIQLFQGIVYSAVLIVPHTVVALFAIILATREAFLMSNLFLGSAIPKLYGDISLETIKLYTLKFLVLSVIVLVSALADCMLTFLFARLFV